MTYVLIKFDSRLSNIFHCRRGDIMGRKLHIISFLIFCSIVILTLPQISVENNSIVSDRTFTTSDRDYWPTEGWRNSTPEDQEMSSEDINAMMDFFEEQNVDIHSVMITKHGYVVYEEYLTSAYNENSKHPLHSETKSFTSTLVGIAIDKGYIDNVSQTVLQFFPEYTITNIDERRERITIEHLLTMRSGMCWNETGSSYLSPENDVSYVLFGDGVDHCLNLDMEAEPGDLWHYNGGASHLLAAIVQTATNTSLLDFATEYLFKPLGIDNVYWSHDGGGFWYTGAWGLELTTRSLAKFGYLFLNNGIWNDTQIISAEWVEKATSTITTIHNYQGYGYQWWTNPQLSIFYAEGRNGQFIIVVPDQDIVAVFTSGIYDGNSEVPLYAFEDYILHNESQNIITIGIGVVVIVIALAIIVYYKMRNKNIM